MWMERIFTAFIQSVGKGWPSISNKAIDEFSALLQEAHNLISALSSAVMERISAVLLP
jgi:hypothetical protein